MNQSHSIKPFISLLCIFGLAQVLISCGYLQVNPPPDVKADHTQGDQSAWLAAASNMLASAGYGYGADIQARAENIYGDMTDHYGNDQPGWTDAALQWWLSSPNNEWPQNPYKLVTVVGHKANSSPWPDQEFPSRIANLLRTGNLVVASISWPDPSLTGGHGTGGHVLNCWGDDLGLKSDPNVLPAHLRVTDCYRNKGGIIQTYRYDDFFNPNPDGANCGQGWYISYDKNHPFIKHIIVLSPVEQTVTGTRAFGSRLLFQMNNQTTKRVSEIRLEFLHDGPFLSYKGWLLVDEDAIEGNDAGISDKLINTGWKLNRNDLESGRIGWIALESTSEANSWTGIQNLVITGNGDDPKLIALSFSCSLEGNPVAERHQSNNATGGYLLFSLDFSSSVASGKSSNDSFHMLVSKQYPADMNPEQPVLKVTAPAGYALNTVKAGHSYGSLSSREQMEFSSWMVNKEMGYEFSGDTLSLPITLLGLLPFPEGENYFIERTP